MRILDRSVRVAAVAALLGGATLLAGCTGADPEIGASSSTGSVTSTDAPSPSPSTNPSPSPSAPATPAAAAGGGLSATDPSAPYDPAEAARWSDGIATDVTTLFGLESTPPGIVTHLDAETTESQRVTAGSLAPGDYSFHLACRGGGRLQLAITSGGATSPVIDGACTSELISGDFTAAEGGTEFLFTSTGDPIDVALHYSPATP